LPQLLLVFNFCSNNYLAAAVICLRTQSVDITKISSGLRELKQVHCLLAERTGIPILPVQLEPIPVKTRSFLAIYVQNDDFTKTGSGQT
jgi:hypothetical protein